MATIRWSIPIYQSKWNWNTIWKQLSKNWFLHWRQTYSLSIGTTSTEPDCSSWKDFPVKWNKGCTAISCKKLPPQSRLKIWCSDSDSSMHCRKLNWAKKSSLKLKSAISPFWPTPLAWRWIWKIQDSWR
jgi:hypothetical protein